jgi:hypothetical protein
MGSLFPNTAATLVVMGLLFTVPGQAHAALHDRGGGLIYDDVLNLTWLQDANFAMTSGYDADGRMNWEGAVAWANGLNFYDAVRGVTYSDWRLPSVSPVNGEFINLNLAYDGSTDAGWNVGAPDSIYPGSVGSELAYTFHINLTNVGRYDTEGNLRSNWSPMPNVTFIDGTSGLPAEFWNIQPTDYWYDTDTLPNDAFYFGFDVGTQFDGNKGNQFFAWAVRDGDVTPVPEQSSSILLISALGILLVRQGGQGTPSTAC